MEPATIKQRLLAEIQKHADSRGRVSISPDALGKRFDLSGHDLVKNLDQLRKEGLIELKWGSGDRLQTIRLKRGAMNEALLSGRTPALTLADRIIQWLLSQPTQFGGWVMATPAEVRKALGAGDTGPTISKMLRTGALQSRKTGARIVALRVVGQQAAAAPRMAEEPSTPAAEAAPRSAARIPATPALDQYVAARRIARMAPAGNPYLTVLFNEDPIAEEAIGLRDALRAALGVTS